VTQVARAALALGAPRRPGYHAAMRWLLVYLAVAGCARAGKENSIIGGLTDARPRSGDSGIVPEPDASPIDAPTAQVAMNQTASGAIDTDNLYGCFDPSTGFSRETSYYRVFTLADYAVASTLRVTEVDFAIADATGAGGQQPGKVNLYSYGGPIDGTTLDLSQVRMVSSVDIQIADGTGTRMAVPITGDVAPSTNLLVEIMTPDGLGDGNDFSLGTNTAGERHPGYVRSPSCGSIADPTAMSSLGFGEVDALISAIGITGAPD